MVERVRSKKLLHCSDENFHALAVAMNSRPQTVTVAITILDDVARCHHRATGSAVHMDRMLAQLIPSLRLCGRKYYSLDRQELFAFQNAHGKVCPHG